MTQKSNSMLEFQAYICWMITLDYKVRLGQVKSEFNRKRPKLTRSIPASKLSIFPMKYNSVHWFQIAHAVENLCIPIIWAFEPCWKIVESCLPDMIQAFVDFAGPPEEYCYLLFLCPDRPTTPGIEY